MERKKCNVDSKCFCYVCGCYIIGKIGKNISKALRDAYSYYFGFSVANTHKPWVPKLFCKACSTKLYKWSLGQEVYFSFLMPMLWREPKNHVDDCYFCLMNVVGLNAKKLSKYKYADVSSVSKPVPRTNNDPLPICPDVSANSMGTFSASPTNSSSPTEDFNMEETHLISQSMLNDLIRDLDLSKQKAELVASRLQEWNCLDTETKVTVYRTRNQALLPFFKKEENICFCDDINGLFQVMNTPYDVNEWRLFIDGSKYSLKAGLIHNGNIKPSILIAHAVQTKECYDTMCKILTKIKYNEHQWKICGDLKV